jgi:hypothetical protein
VKQFTFLLRAESRALSNLEDMKGIPHALAQTAQCAPHNAIVRSHLYPLSSTHTNKPAASPISSPEPVFLQPYPSVTTPRCQPLNSTPHPFPPSILGQSEEEKETKSKQFSASAPVFNQFHMAGVRLAGVRGTKQGHSLVGEFSGCGVCFRGLSGARDAVGRGTGIWGSGKVG